MKEEHPQSAGLIEFGPFSFDQAVGKLCKHGTTIRLSGMPLKILQHLVERPGEAVSRAELQHLLWNGTAFGDFERGLNSAVNVVRRALSDSADQPRYIETLPGQGYRFIAPVHIAAEHKDIRETPVERKAPSPMFRWWVAAALAVAAVGGGAWKILPSKPQTLSHGEKASANKEANDQYELAMGFLLVQNDIPLARKTFARALELDPHFASARLQLAMGSLVEIFNGFSNDASVLYQAEEDLHRAEQDLPASNGLLLAAQAGVYQAQGRLDRIPREKLEENWRRGGYPFSLAIIRMREGQTEEPLAMLRAQIDRNPLDNPCRMFAGELQRTKGDTVGAIQTLERVVQQGPRHMAAAWFLTMAYLDNGKPEQARTLLEGMRSEFEKNYMWRHAWAIVLSAEGKRDEARQAMDEDTLKFARLTWSVTSTTADFYALQGDRSKAMEWLQLAIAHGDERVSYFRRNPRLATLREDTRFQSLLKSVEARRK